MDEVRSLVSLRALILNGKRMTRFMSLVLDLLYGVARSILTVCDVLSLSLSLPLSWQTMRSRQFPGLIK